MYWLISLMLFLCCFICLPLALIPGRGGAAWELLPALTGVWLSRFFDEATTSSLSLLLLIGVAGVAIDRAFPTIDERRLGASKGGMAGAAVGMLLAVIFSGPWLWPFLLPLSAGLGDLLDRQQQNRETPEAPGALLTLAASGLLMMLTITPWT